MTSNDWRNKYDHVAGEDDGDGYDWRQTDIWHKGGKFYVYNDSGCSCNYPYENGERDLRGPYTFHEALSGKSVDIKSQALRWEAAR